MGESSARKKLPPPSVVPSSWLSCPSWLLGKQNWSAPHCPLQGYRQMRFLLGTSDSRPPWYWYRSAPVPKKLLQMAGIEDCYTAARGSTGTLGNFAKATYAAIAKTYAYLTPDLWTETVFVNSPYQDHSDFLSKNHRTGGTQKQEAKAY